MKTNPYRKFNPLFIFKKNKRFTTHLSMFLTLAFLHLIVGCSYYTVRNVSTTPVNIPTQIEELNQSHDYIIIHSGDEIWYLGNALIDTDNKLISGIVLYDDYIHDFQNERKVGRTYQYNKSNQSPLNELHFYLDSIAIPEAGYEISIPISKIKTVSVNDKNTLRTIEYIVLPIVLLGAIVVGSFFKTVLNEG